jgi:hypothetical protein
MNTSPKGKYMAQIANTVSEKWLAIAVVGFAVACGNANESGTTAPVVSPDGLEKRLVNREYPYWVGDGLGIVCAEWEMVSKEGTVVDIKHEWYPVKTMNRHLGNVGTPQAVPHVDAAFRDALLERGISRIETCDHAREYLRLNSERSSSLTAEELKQRMQAALAARPVPFGAPQPGQPALLATPPEQEPPTEIDNELVDKIIVSSSFDHPSTVGFGCTGQLISRFAMLTAGHCVFNFAYSGSLELRAYVQPEGAAQQCISHAGGGNCPAPGGAHNAFYFVHPDYDFAKEYDYAVVIHNPGWHAPANTSARWTRFASNWQLPMHALTNASAIRIDGYGANATNGAGFGVGRRGSSTHTITSIGGTFEPFNPITFGIPRPNSGWSGGCGGDSGSGANNTTIVSGTNITLGVFWGGLPVDGACTAAGGTMHYNIIDGPWVSSLSAFFGQSCNTFSSAGGPYLRCW